MEYSKTRQTFATTFTLKNRTCGIVRFCLFAAYDGEYECAALVVYRRYQKLYEVNGTNCSCYGLEDQWDPEETSVEALRHRIDRGTLGYFLGGYTADFSVMLDKLSREGEQTQYMILRTPPGVLFRSAIC